MRQDTLNILKLKETLAAELETRRVSSGAGDFRHSRRGNEIPLYGVTGAANVHAILGIGMGGWRRKAEWAERINSFQRTDGSFTSPSGLEHAASMSILALNILGHEPSRPVKDLAPADSAKLLKWLKKLNWTGTHKDFCGGVIPVLASGLADEKWTETLKNHVSGRISPENPAAIWCSPEDEPWRVISCVYHITSGLDAGLIPYPHPELIWESLRGLNYESVRDDVHRTACTDFDYIFVMGRLTRQLPGHFADYIRSCRAIFQKRLSEWTEKKERLFENYSTHDLFCYLTGWALLQAELPELFTGPSMTDTQNAAWLYRLAPDKLAPANAN
jgi:hypothetical protein